MVSSGTSPLKFTGQEKNLIESRPVETELPSRKGSLRVVTVWGTMTVRISDDAREPAPSEVTT